MGLKIGLSELTKDNVSTLTEEDVFNLLLITMGDIPKDQSSKCVDIINTCFDFRSVSTKNRRLKGDLSYSGYKFFSPPDSKNLCIGIRRKSR